MNRTHLVVGPDGHGVTRHAARAAELVGGDVVRLERPMTPGDVDVVRRRLPAGTLVHLDVTDRLFGPDPERAAQTVVELLRDRRGVVTLHDLPQASDGPLNQPRRAAAYDRIARAAAHLVVSSRHERALLRSFSEAGPVSVVPLPLGVAPVDPLDRPAVTGRRRDVGVLGWLYPGKGHPEVLAALRDMPADVGLLALGAPSPGHEDIVVHLRRTADAMGRRCGVSGFVADTEWTARLRAVAVPVAAHTHLSASGSIGSWLAAGRRPIVPDHPYTREIEDMVPGCVVTTSDLAGSMAAALADPDSTWVAPGAPPGWSEADVAAALQAFPVAR